ncbi:M23 family metallopeptidase [Nocardioides malaquae]|uniref:M23 family metallopeptidase n=1 Tax=Nocardioides malaquae TaxID=2773426 RepID=UPI0029D412FD|nr:peptidoglycan DD-metalloendopeptidase family protein [Nocardioides malaquae]
MKTPPLPRRRASHGAGRPGHKLARFVATVGLVLFPGPHGPAGSDAPDAPDGASGQAGTGVWPLPGTPQVVTGFSPPDERWDSGHRGVDLASAPAQPVLAALPGEVTFAGSVAGRGVVVVSHGPTRTTYQPVLADVAVSTPVSAGQRIGWLHPAGSHCAPAACLHWGWRFGDLYLDPLDLVGGTGVRLLPLWGLPGLLPGFLPPWPAYPLQARGWAWE